MVMQAKYYVGKSDIVIENNRDPETIRGFIGIDNFNTIIHASDADPSIVKREKK